MAKLTATITRPVQAKTSTVNMKIGDIALTDSFGESELLLRTYDGFVNLNQPSRTYMSSLDRDADVLPPGSTVTLKVLGIDYAQLEAKMLEHLKTGNLINAIKEARDVTAMGLKESKEYVEKFRQTSWDNGTLPLERTTTRVNPGAVAPAPKPTLGWDEFITDDEPPF
jgi:hypothetical protein